MKSRHGVVENVGMATCVDCPRDCSMYINSRADIVGCLAGFSKESHNQNKYLWIEFILFSRNSHYNICLVVSHKNHISPANP